MTTNPTDRIATPADDARNATEKVATLVGELIRLEPHMTTRTRLLLGAVAQWASIPVQQPPPTPAAKPTKRTPAAPNQQTLNGAT